MCLCVYENQNARSTVSTGLAVLIPRFRARGGSIIQDEAGKFHMFAAEMSNGCGLNTWTTNSIIVSATSDMPEGPYVLNLPLYLVTIELSSCDPLRPNSTRTSTCKRR